MFRLSKLADYATVLMACMAQAPDALASAQSLAERTRLELPTVAKLLKQLSQAGLVQSTRGVNGGYRLARPAVAISVADIIGAIEGSLGMTECSIHHGLCGREDFCTVSSNLRKISLAVETALRAVTLADLSAPTRDWQTRVSVDRLPIRVETGSRA